MGIAEGRPPYTADEIDRIAGAHIFGEAWGLWFATPEAATVFSRPIGRLSLDKRCDMIAGGVLWLYEFGSWTCDPHSKGGPRFQTMKWLDATSLKAMLKSAWSKLKVGNDPLRPWMKGTWIEVAEAWETEADIDRLVDAYDRKRAQAVPSAYKRFSDVASGQFDPIKMKLAYPMTYKPGDEERG